MPPGDSPPFPLSPPSGPRGTAHVRNVSREKGPPAATTGRGPPLGPLIHGPSNISTALACAFSERYTSARQVARVSSQFARSSVSPLQRGSSCCRWGVQPPEGAERRNPMPLYIGSIVVWVTDVPRAAAF